MTLPSFNAEQSLYRSSRHYRSSALASAVGGIRPSDIPPKGSYQDTCSACCYSSEDDILVCFECDDVSGVPQIAEPLFNVSECDSDIANCNATLTCGPCPFH
jgi:hypothetical protein